ncbi:hypothetical protein [Actinoplanes sp. HUAS TT8]|uniref:hypothetical protein n=1 Tax=Actinoplanes sp. HUAS TT8 TaxID=3447453 RepID=UPI003F52339A
MDRKWKDADLLRLVPAVRSWRQLAMGLGLSGRGGRNFNMIKADVMRLGVSVDHFVGQGWRAKSGNGRDPEKQREAKRRWYQENRELYLARNARRRRERVDLLRTMKSVPCMDCGVEYPYFVMDFDHREGEKKEFALAHGTRSVVGLERFMAEAEKCDVVCANCHRFRTAQRGGWFQFASDRAGD